MGLRAVVCVLRCSPRLSAQSVSETLPSSVVVRGTADAMMSWAGLARAARCRLVCARRMSSAAAATPWQRNVQWGLPVLGVAVVYAVWSRREQAVAEDVKAPATNDAGTHGTDGGPPAGDRQPIATARSANKQKAHYKPLVFSGSANVPVRTIRLCPPMTLLCD